jgi:hypothetical protein
MYIFLLCLSALLTALRLAGLHVVSWWLVFTPIFVLFAAWITWIIR